MSGWNIGDERLRADAGRRLRRVLHHAGGVVPAGSGRLVARAGGGTARELLHRVEQRVRSREARPRRMVPRPRRHERHRTRPRSSSPRQFGATVVTTAGSDDKTAFCRGIGADYAINYRTQDFAEEVKRITDKRGVDVILDMVGGDYIERNLQMPGARRSAVADRVPVGQPRRMRLALHHAEAADGHRFDAARKSRARARPRSRASCARTCGRCSRAQAASR